MNKKFHLFFIPFLLIPIYVSANSIISTDNPNSPISREEMAVVSSRLIGMEGQKNAFDYKSKFIDVSGWSNPFINIAYENKIMSGISDNKFNPGGNVTNIEVLTILMRTMGYKDGIDFKSYPIDYYNKALEIGLADLYSPMEKILTRNEVSNLIDKSLSKTNNHTTNSNNNYSNNSNPKLIDIKFNKNVFSEFKGRLIDVNDFTTYEIKLLSNSGKLYGKSKFDSNGNFLIKDFNIDVFSRLNGYKYELYNDGYLILEDSLSN